MNRQWQDLGANRISRVFGIAFLVLTPLSLSAGETYDYLHNAAELVVMLENPLAGDEKSWIGSGIVFGQDESHLYIATTSRSKMQHQESPGAYNIYLRADPETAMQADLLASLGGEPSTVVLRVNKAKYQPQLQDICLRFDRLSEKESIQRGTLVYAAGSVPSLPWAMPVLPDAVIRAADNEIVFQTAFLGPGHTGGALLDEQGHILGMIQRRSGPLGFATAIDTIVDQLRAQGYPISLRKSKYGPDNPLLEASQSWDEEEIKTLIDECHDVNARDADGNVPLHFAVRNGSAEIVTRLLERSANPNVANEGCGIPLTITVARNDLEIAKLLLSSGGNPAWGRCGRPIRKAVDQQNGEMLKILLAAHPWKTDQYDEELVRNFYRSVRLGWLEGIMLFLDAGVPIDVRDNSDKGVLHWVTYGPEVNEEAVAYLLEQGASVNVRDRERATPLHLAVTRSDSSHAVVELLIAAGAELDAQDHRGQTPLHRAFYRRSEVVAAKLFEACANPYVRDKDGKIPMEGATQVTLRKVFTFLVRSGSYAKNQACPEDVRLSVDTIY